MITSFTLHNVCGTHVLHFHLTGRITLLEGDEAARTAILESLLLLSCGVRPENLAALAAIGQAGRAVSGLDSCLQTLARSGPVSLRAMLGRQKKGFTLFQGSVPPTTETKKLVRRAAIRAEEAGEKPTAPAPADWHVLFQDGTFWLDGSVRLTDRTLVTSWTGGREDMRFPRTVFIDDPCPAGGTRTEPMSPAARPLCADALRGVLSGTFLAAGLSRDAGPLADAVADGAADIGEAPRNSADPGSAAPAPADRALPDPRLAARLARLARAVFDAQDGLLLVGRLGGGLPREHCRLEWLVLEELSRILRVQVFASAADGTVYEEACRTWTGQKDLCLAHLDPGITATPVLLWSGRHFDAGLDDPRRGERAHRAPGAGAGAGETKAADESLLPQEPYLWVAAGEARAARGLDDAGAAALLGAALRPCGDEAVPAKARRTRVPRQRTGPLITRLVLRGLGGLPGLELPEMRRFSFLDGADAAARDALLDGLLLLSLSRHPEAALMLPAVRGLPATMENALAILRDLARNAPGGPAAAGADSAPGFFATALAGPDGAVSDLVTEVLEGWRLERLPASLPTAGQGSCTLIFREQRHLMRVLLDLSGETPAAGWSVSRVTPFALRVIHVDASKPMDAGLKALLKTLHGEELDALACAMLPLARNARRPDPAGLALTLSISPGMLPISDAPVEARRRAAQLVAGVLAARGGILAADHVGRDLPPDFVGPLWRVLENLAGRMQVQIVAVMDDPALYEAARNGAASRGDFCLLAPRVPGTAATPETAGTPETSGSSDTAGASGAKARRARAKDGTDGSDGSNGGDNPRKAPPAARGAAKKRGSKPLPAAVPDDRALGMFQVGSTSRAHVGLATLTSLQINKLRDFRLFEVRGLGPITLLAGTGALDVTALLEACVLLTVFRYPARLVLLNRLRGLPETAEGHADLLRGLLEDRNAAGPICPAMGPVDVEGTMAAPQGDVHTRLVLGRYTQRISDRFFSLTRRIICHPPDPLKQPEEEEDWLVPGVSPALRLYYQEDGKVRTGRLRLEDGVMNSSWKSETARTLKPTVVLLDMERARSTETMAAMAPEMELARRRVAEALRKRAARSGGESAARALEVMTGPKAARRRQVLPGTFQSCLSWSLLRLVNATDGILLVNRMETAVPQGRLAQFWKLLEGVSLTLNIQIIATATNPVVLRAAERVLLDRDRMRVVHLPTGSRQRLMRAVPLSDLDTAYDPDAFDF